VSNSHADTDDDRKSGPSARHGGSESSVWRRRSWLGQYLATDAGIGATPTSVATATVFALTTPLFLAGDGIPIGVVGATLLIAGAVAGVRAPIEVGTVVLLAAVLVTGTADPGVSALRLLCATLTAVLAWDIGRYGVRIGRQLGTGAATLRIEVAHALTSTAVGIAGVSLGYLVYLAVEGAQSLDAFVLLFVGTLLVLGWVRAVARQ